MYELRLLCSPQTDVESVRDVTERERKEERESEREQGAEPVKSWKPFWGLSSPLLACETLISSYLDSNSHLQRSELRALPLSCELSPSRN